jgi:chemotaxis protein MotB
MKFILHFVTVGILAVSCVPAKKYNELLEREKTCSEELASYKSRSLAFEAEAITLAEKVTVLVETVDALRSDTSAIGHEYRTLNAKYMHLTQLVETLETNYDKLRLSGARDIAQLQADLEIKRAELLEKEARLNALEVELQRKEQALKEREQRVEELEALLRNRDEALKLLKDRVAQALLGFKDKGLKVEERNGKIYVSLEARLLFASGSIAVEPEGKTALIDLAHVLETEKDLEIIVEGHTDTDKLSSANHPRNNWELSVLRSTSVISIMLENSSMNPSQIMAGGRSEFVPVDPNDKSKNRRIEIILSPNLNALYELINK